MKKIMIALILSMGFLSIAKADNGNCVPNFPPSIKKASDHLKKALDRKYTFLDIEETVGIKVLYSNRGFYSPILFALIERGNLDITDHTGYEVEVTYFIDTANNREYIMQATVGSDGGNTFGFILDNSLLDYSSHSEKGQKFIVANLDDSVVNCRSLNAHNSPYSAVREQEKQNQMAEEYFQIYIPN